MHTRYITSITNTRKEKLDLKQVIESNRVQEKFKVRMDTSQSQTQDICFEVRATALLPAFTSVKGFHYPPRTLTTVYQRPEHRAPPITMTSTEEVSPQVEEEHKEPSDHNKITKLFTNSHSFTTSL